MAMQLSLDRCGVVLVGHSQGGTAPVPQPQKGPTSATDCGSDPLLMAGGGQSRATGHQTLQDTEVGTKLWGQAAELQRAADFLAATGLRI